MKTKIIAIALVAIATSTLVSATHSASPCSAAEITTIDAGAATLYIANDGLTTATWVYLESNGHAGLQRGGFAWYETGLGTGIDDECWDIEFATGEQILDPDTILY